MALKPTQDNYT